MKNFSDIFKAVHLNLEIHISFYKYTIYFYFQLEHNTCEVKEP